MGGNLCIIPARGGSKRIPRKNIRDFLGKPIIAYTIETAIKSTLFEEVMVSTDDVEIADIAKNYGASIPFYRSDAVSDDQTPIADVVDEVRNIYSKKGRQFKFICCLLPTAVLTTTELLRKGLETLEERDGDSMRPVVRFGYPIQRAFRLVDGKVDFWDPTYRLTRSQDLEPAYHDSGMFYWMKAEKGLRGESRLGFEISEMHCQDIDNEVDWKLAELKFKLLIS